MRRTLPLFVLLLTLVSIHSASQQRKVIHDRAEYKAYMSALSLENDPQKAAAMEAFIARYPSSVMKVDALAVVMECYRHLYEVDKVEKTALRILELDPNHIRALTILTGMNHAWATSAGDPQQAAQFAQRARSYAARGMEALKTWQKPQNMTDASFDKLHTQMMSIFSESLTPGTQGGNGPGSGVSGGVIGGVAGENHTGTSAAGDPTNRMAARKETVSKAEEAVENDSEIHSIEKNHQSVLKVRNALLYQATFEANKSGDYYQIEWPGFYEFRNPGDAAIVITDFRVAWLPESLAGKQLKLTHRSQPDKIAIFDDLAAVQKSQKEESDPSPVKFPITIPPRSSRFVKLHLAYDLFLEDKPLKLDKEDDAYYWLAQAIGLHNSAGHFQCTFTEVPIEVSTAGDQVLRYEPFTALIVPGCQMNLPPLPAK